MNVLKFAEEFTRLIIRYTRTSSHEKNDPSNSVMSLTEGEIVYTIHHVLHALSIKGFEDKNNNNNLLEISNSVNVTIPETSVVNIKHEPDIENMCSFQDAQSVFTDDDSSVSDTSLKTSKKGQENSFNALQNEKKFISRSNPAICINNISRSDTFVRDESKKINTEDQEDVFENYTNAETHNLSSDLFQVSLDEIRKSAMDIMAKLNNLEQSFPQSIKLLKEVTAKVQQPSLINSHSSPRRASTMNKTKVSTNIRKPTSKTPISSKLIATESGNIFERRKSTGGIGTNAIAGKSGESKMVCSVLNLTLSANNKASPSSSIEFQPKFTKNPKYAHVRSTIPKPSIQKKKMQ